MAAINIIRHDRYAGKDKTTPLETTYSTAVEGDDGKTVAVFPRRYPTDQIAVQNTVAAISYLYGAFLEDDE